MHRQTSIGFVLASLLAIGASGCFGEAPKEVGGDDRSGSPSSGTRTDHQTTSKDAPSTASGEPTGEGLRAKITERTSKKDYLECSVGVVSLSVEVPSFEAQTRINKALKFDIDDRLIAEDCEHPVSIEGRFQARFNEGGILSVLYIEDYAAEMGRPFQNIKTHNFDLATGLSIELDEALDATGRAAVVAACKKATSAKGEYGSECQQAVDRDSPIYEIEAAGIRIHPVDVSNIDWHDVAVPGVLAPWSALKGHIAHGPLEALAE